MDPRNITVVFINYRSADLINANLERLLPFSAAQYLVVDNSGEFSTPHPEQCEILRPGNNLGFGSAANLAARHVRTEWMVVVNPDLSITPQALSGFMAATASPDSIALILPAVHAGSPFIGFSPDLGYITKRLPESGGKYLFVQGFCLVALNLEAFQAVGGFDEKIFMYAEDLDLTIRLLRRFGTGCLRSVEVDFIHTGGASYVGPLGKLRRLRDSFRSTCYVLGKHAAPGNPAGRWFQALLFSYPKFVRFFPKTSLPLRQD